MTAIEKRRRENPKERKEVCGCTHGASRAGVKEKEIVYDTDGCADRANRYSEFETREESKSENAAELHFDGASFVRSDRDY